MRWAGKRAGLYPEALQLRVDMIEEALADIRQQLRPPWYKSVMGRHPVSGLPAVALTNNQVS